MDLFYLQEIYLQNKKNGLVISNKPMTSLFFPPGILGDTGKRRRMTTPCICISRTVYVAGTSLQIHAPAHILPAKVRIYMRIPPRCPTELTITAISSIDFSHRKHRLPLSCISNCQRQTHFGRSPPARHLPFRHCCP